MVTHAAVWGLAVRSVKQLLQLKQNNAKQFQNKSKTKPKQFVLGLFQHFVHVKQNAETEQK